VVGAPSSDGIKTKSCRVKSSYASLPPHVPYTTNKMPTASSSRPAKAPKSKPYDRNLSASYTSLSAPAAPVETGAPATHGQKTRKGKKAWRKNIDVSQEEEAMEQARAEERVTGWVNSSLFWYSNADQIVGNTLRRRTGICSLSIPSEMSRVSYTSSLW
jgi:nucleolar protein 53